MRFYLTSEISQNLGFTPEGFLSCGNVPVARTGDQTYFEGEVPITPDQNGAITIARDAEEVFADSAISSFEGKPVIISHPEGFVTPDNWKGLAVGTMHNVRRGEGLNQDVLLSDLLIADKEAIRMILEREVREVSCGYDADYIEIEKGRGKQQNIRGNHIALVDKGRCGALCAIHDSKGGTMKGWLKKFWDSLPADDRKEFRDAVGEEESKKKKDDDEENESIDKKKARDARINRMLDAFEKKEKEEEMQDVDFFTGENGEPHPIRGSSGYSKKKAGDRRAKDAEEEEEEGEIKKRKEEEMAKEGKDCSPARDAMPIFQDILYRSSILAPDLQRPTADSVKTMGSKNFKDTCCRIKRASLDSAYKVEKGQAAIKPFLNGARTIDFYTADCRVIDIAFAGASELLKASGTQDRVGIISTKDFGKTITVAEINKQNRAFWASRNGGN